MGKHWAPRTTDFDVHQKFVNQARNITVSPCMQTVKCFLEINFALQVQNFTHGIDISSTVRKISSVMRWSSHCSSSRGVIVGSPRILKGGGLKS